VSGADKPVETVRVPDLADLTDLLDLAGGLRPADLPDTLLAVDLGGSPSRWILRAAAVAAACPIPVVGVLRRPPHPDEAALLDALTCTVAPGTGELPQIAYAGDVGDDDVSVGLAEMAAAVAAAPRAAVTLDGVLRLTARLPIWEGLIAESTAYSMLLAGPEFASWLDSARRPGPPPQDDEPVLVGLEAEQVLHLQLNRPQRRNAYGRAVRDALVDGLAIALADESLRVLLTGVGPAFCSGGDLAEFGTAPDPATAHRIRVSRSVGWLLHQLADRTTVQVHGACVGAGIELPSFTAHVVAAPETTFRLPEVGMGLIPGAGGTVSITARIGRWRTAWWALTCRPLGVGPALRWGLIDEVTGATKDAAPG
jgi:enoyl-CoA hydratase/carnithine racemase